MQSEKQYANAVGALQVHGLRHHALHYVEFAMSMSTQLPELRQFQEIDSLNTPGREIRLWNER